MATEIADVEGVAFDHYKVLTRSDGSLFELGRGAMGITYKAFDTNLRVPVALKVINTQKLDSAGARERFVQEARSAAKLRHQHVASVFHLGMDGGSCFYAMEYIAGETLETIVKRLGPLPPVLVLRIGVQVAKALAAAQQHGLVHRDIKPSNLMLVSVDDELSVKVIDFGLAKHTYEDESWRSLGAGGFVGTPHFASPEQLRALAIDVRSDIYSLGCTLWYMLTGHPPFGGTLAEIIKQQLEAAPPRAKLAAIPAAVAALLERMLAKDPAGRPQTAADLRRDFEQAIVESSKDHTLAGLRLEEQRIAAELGGRQQESLVDLTTRMVVAGRYDVLERLGESNEGWVYRAHDMTDRRDVRLLLLRQAFTAEQEAFTRLEQDLEKLRAVAHPNLLRIYGLEVVERAAVISMEWTEGVTLREVLRSRSSLAPGEVLLLLDQMAAGVDHALQAEMARLDLALHQIYLHFPELQRDRKELLGVRVPEWPPFEVKLNPLGFSREVSLSQTWAGAQTVVGPMETTPPLGAGATAAPFVRELAVLVYELMGGTLKSVVAASVGVGAGGRYTPLAQLTEEANEVMRRAMDPARTFKTAGEFVAALHAVSQLETRVRDVPPPALSPVPDFPAENPYPAPAPQGTFWKPALLSAAALLVLVGVAAYVTSRPEKAATPSAATPLAVETPASTPVPPPATPALPERRDELRKAVVAAESLEAQKDLRGAIGQWIEVARKFPEAGVGKMRLDLLLDDVRLREEKLGPEELTLLQPALEEAARLGSTSAMLLLGESLRLTNPPEAYQWTVAAANKGVPAALTWQGLMLASGTGVTKDVSAAAACLEKAAAMGDPTGLGALGECYLFGKGVEKDPEHGVELLQKAVAKGDLRAMDRLGTCYQKGIGTPKNFAEAKRLISAAAEKGFGNAIGNLGVLYMRGDGVEPDIKKGLELFQKGAKSGDPYCMLLYAQALEEGVGISKDTAEARLWYQHAAEGGMPPAIEWCRKNGVEFAKTKNQ